MNQRRHDLDLIELLTDILHVDHGGPAPTFADRCWRGAVSVEAEEKASKDVALPLRLAPATRRS